MIRVAAFTTGQQIPGSRFRVRQYIQSLAEHDVEVTEFFTRPGAYPPQRKLIRPFWAIYTLGSRLPSIVRSYDYDVTLFQREMVSTFLTLEPLTKKPRVLDVDDAIWLNRDSGFARRLAGLCDSVICGNSFLAEYFSQWNPNVVILPTAVDSDRFAPLPAENRRHDAAGPVIGWSGGQGGFLDLQVAEDALRIILKKYPGARLRVMADEPPNLDLPAGQVEFVRWSPEVEVQAIQGFDIGIMPLRDTMWSRGKCAYKMLLYMSCGVPVVVSPVGMTREVCDMAPVGHCAATTNEWIDALEDLLNNQERASVMGENARKVVVRDFSLQALAPRLATELLRVAGFDPKLSSNASSRLVCSGRKEA